MICLPREQAAAYCKVKIILLFTFIFFFVCKFLSSVCFDMNFFYVKLQDIEKQEGYQAWIIGIVEKGQRTARIIDKPRVIEVPAKEKEGELW